MALPHHDGDEVQPEPKVATPGRAGRTIRKVAVGAVGATVTAAGVVMLVTPGPGVVVALAGLAILGREFPSVRRRLDSTRSAVSSRLRDRR